MTMRERLAARGENGKFVKSPTPNDPARASVESGPDTAALEVTPPALSADEGLDAISTKLLDETAPKVRAKPSPAPLAKPDVKPVAPAPSSGGSLLPLLGGFCAALLLGVMGYQIANTSRKQAPPTMPNDKASLPVKPPAPRSITQQMFTEV